MAWDTGAIVVLMNACKGVSHVSGQERSTFETLAGGRSRR